jgi:hypothetical protein
MPGAQRLHGYRSAPDFAWSGWRYRIPGGPEGGQYHGFIAPDSTQSWEGGQGGWPGGKSEIPEGPQKRPSGHSLLPGQGSSWGPWDHNWGGTSFGEGQTHSDHSTPGDHNVYRSPSEMRPRPNASGGVNVIFGHQDEATAGYAEAPGNYRGLGLVPVNTELMPVDPWRYPPGLYPVPPAPNPPLPPPRPGPIAYEPVGPVWGGMYPIRFPYNYGEIPSSGYGATNVVGQPAPATPAPQSLVPWTPPPVTPSPAPVVTAQPSDYYPSQGAVIDGLTPGTPSAPTAAAPTDISSWLSASTIIPNVANQWIVLGVVGAFLMSGKGKR